MKNVFLNRLFYDDKQTLGTLTVPDKEIFICKTLELAWNFNKNNVSCIPSGNYLCRWTMSPRMTREHGEPVYTYEVLDVPERAGIRIHPANFYKQLLGCIALGDSHKDINADGELDLIHSGKTLGNFVSLMNKEDFMLNIMKAI